MKDSTVFLLNRVWGLTAGRTDPQWTKRYWPYELHYKHILASVLVDGLREEQFAQFVECIKTLNLHTVCLFDVLKHVRAQKFSWLPESVSDTKILHILSVSVKLWLFTTIEIQRSRGTIKDDVTAAIASSFVDEKKDDLIRLTDDFCAKNLERRGGFTIHWTSELAEHLTCVDGKVIKVFRHVSVLQSYLERDSELEKSLYPDDFLSEIDNTFYLLFPYEGEAAAKLTLKESKKRKVDLVEAGWYDDAIRGFARLQLASYPRFRHRLAEIQRRYDAAVPRHPKQWWYDRRQRMEWAALMIAILVFILTIITLVTSILQVYATFQPSASSRSTR